MRSDEAFSERQAVSQSLEVDGFDCFDWMILTTIAASSEVLLSRVHRGYSEVYQVGLCRPYSSKLEVTCVFRQGL